VLFFSKIWNSTNGQNIHVLPSVEDAEVTGILFSDKGVITIGWSRKIVKYPDIISEVNIHLSWLFLSIIFQDRVDDEKNIMEVFKIY
jgi:hypothetical protein